MNVLFARWNHNACGKNNNMSSTLLLATRVVTATLISHTGSLLTALSSKKCLMSFHMAITIGYVG